ncbi:MULTISPECIES: DUF1214 domain-containing protein [Bradyrhizobium]|uniref:DUF1214 domain-containing protein n=1 Tax=Bradyrhizobium elkanii TaxID=29448 RepID=UPI0034E3DBB6
MIAPRTMIMLSIALLSGTIATTPVRAAEPAASAAGLAGDVMQRRAFEAVVWGMPAVNTDLMLQQAKTRVGLKDNQIVYWSRLPSWKNQTLTPNPDAVYLIAFFNTAQAGPMVLEVPPAGEESITGNIDTVWQVALEDAGPSGADKGKGGKYLILPPGYSQTPPDGYIPLRSDTSSGYALLRSTPKSGSDADVAKAVAYGRQIKLYPLSRADSPPETKFVDAVEVVFDSTIPYDIRFFEALDRIVQSEPWLERDRAMIDQLRSIGIEKGKPFNPDAGTRNRLEAGARDAHAWLEYKYTTAFAPYNEGHRWGVPAAPDVIEGQSDSYAKHDSYPVDARGLTYSYGFVGIKRLGAGQFYLMTIADKTGNALVGASQYRLTVPANAPVAQYWSATAYDRATHAFIRDMPRFSRSSQNPELQKNADGSVDVYFGPAAPAGKETNWIPTRAGGEFEVLFRLYGPQKPLFDKSWVLPDIERVAAGAGPASPTAGTAAATTDTVPVTADNFVRAETDLYFGGVVKKDGFGKFEHNREALPIDKQTVIRTNRDTLYSGAVFDLDAGPVTITLPDAGKRFMSMQVIDEDQYTPEVIYRPGRYTFSRDKIGTRYVVMAVRILVDPNNPKDVEQVHALQDAIRVNQKSSGKFEVPNFDPVSQKKVREALLALASTLPDTKGMFGARGKVDPVRRLIGAASAWGGNPEKDALYLNVTPAKNDGAAIYRLDVKDVPVDGFWSISLYNKEGYFQANPYGAYSLNSITAKRNADGAVTVQFGGCDGKIANCLPIMAGWNYMVRLYRPRAEVLNGKWKFPEAQAVN